MQSVTIKKRGKPNQKAILETALPVLTELISSPECLPSNLILTLKKVHKTEDDVLFTEKDILSYKPTIDVPSAFDPNEGTGNFMFVDTNTSCEKNVNKVVVEHIKEKVDGLCWWCCHKFQTKPLKMPVCKNCDGTYECVGNFCSPECTCAYILDSGYRFGDKWKEYDLLHEMLDTNTSIKPAPKRELLNAFGGELTIEKFRGVKKFNLVYPPMVSLKMHMDDAPSNENDEQTLFSNNTFKLGSLSTEQSCDMPLPELKKKKKEKVSQTGSLDRFWGVE